MQYPLTMALFVVVACEPGDSSEERTDKDAPSDTSVEQSTDETSPPDTSTEESTDVALLSGVYDVSTVTCDGKEVPISVIATVTFDGTSYLEEWTFPGAECEVALDGTVEATDTELTLRDVAVTCAKACETDGFCDPTPCPTDQVYQYTLDGSELLLSFTQQGSEHACGPCGDGVPGTYLLIRSATP